MPVVELVRPEGAAAVCGVIEPGHTMISVNDKTLLGISLPDAARHIAECAQKTKDSKGTIPCIVRFLKTDVPPTRLEPVSPAGSPSPVKKGSAASAGSVSSKKTKSGGCCFPRKKAQEEVE